MLLLFSFSKILDAFGFTQGHLWGGQVPCPQTTPVGQAYFCTRFPHVSMWLSFSFNLSRVPLTSTVAPVEVFCLFQPGMHCISKLTGKRGMGAGGWEWGGGVGSPHQPGKKDLGLGLSSATCSACDVATHLSSHPAASAFISKTQVNPPQVVPKSQGNICEAPHTASSLWCEPS